jgi:ABC-2 type transport system permease protein
MSRILHHIHIGLLYFRQALKTRMEYRGDFFVECMAALLQQAAGLLVVVFLFNKFEAMKGWSREEVFFIYGFSLIPMSFFDAFSMSFYMFSDRYIVNGELDRLLMRPLSSLFQLIMEGISFDFIADLMLGIGVLSYAWKFVGPPVTLEFVLSFAAFVFGAWGVLAGVFLSLTALSFWSQDRLSFLPPVYNLLNFARYPLNIYRPIIRVLLTWVIPFGFVAFYPSIGLMKHPAINDMQYLLPAHLLFVVPIVGLAMLCLGATIWRLGIRRYSGAGS